MVEGDVEYWLARELQWLLGYSNWQNFERVVEGAKIACKKAGGSAEDHFTDASKMIGLGKGAARRVQDIALTRYACYLIAPERRPAQT
jgi:DNA-damage-inducible protein D